MYRNPGFPKDSFSLCFFVSKFRTALRAHCAPEGYANRKIELDIQSTKEYLEYLVGTTAYDILKDKKINLDVVKEKISKNERLLFYSTDGDLLELKNLIQRKNFKFLF